MIISETKLYKEVIKDNPTLYRLLKENNKFSKITNLKLSDAGETKNFIFCFVFSLSYLMLNNKIEELAPRTIKKLFSYMLGEFRALYIDADNKHKEFTNKLADNKFLELENREDIAKERFFIYSDAKDIDYSTLESEFRTLEYNYYFYENELNEINLFITLFNSVKDIKPQNERTINRLLNDALDIIKNALDIYNSSVKSELKPKEDKDEISVYRNENIDNIFNFSAVSLYDSDNKGKEIIDRYIKEVENPLKDLGKYKDSGVSNKHTKSLTKKIENASKNIVESYGKYYLIENQSFSTVINVDIKGIYYLTNSEGEKIARIPSSIIVNKSDALYILDKLVYRALKDTNNINYELDLNNSDIAELTNCLEEFNALENNEYKEDSKEYHKAYNKVYYAKDSFINKITNQLFYIRIDTKSIKTSILDFKTIGENYKDGIKIIFDKEYLYLRLTEGILANFNTYILEEFKDNINAVKVYEGILKEILKNEMLKTGEYNYIFSLKQIRSFSGYASKEFLINNLEDSKNKNKKIQESIRAILKKLKELKIIFISKTKDKKEFTIMLNNKTPFIDAYNLFKSQCEKNGHEIDEEN